MITIDSQNRKPIYEQIIDRFQVLIMKGILATDSQMPSVRSLAVELSINPNTIQKAYAALEQQGFIYSVKGRGNYVADCSRLREQKKQELFYRFRQQISYGREIGISKEEYQKLLEECWKEGTR